MCHEICIRLGFGAHRHLPIFHGFVQARKHFCLPLDVQEIFNLWEGKHVFPGDGVQFSIVDTESAAPVFFVDEDYGASPRLEEG